MYIYIYTFTLIYFFRMTNIIAITIINFKSRLKVKYNKLNLSEIRFIHIY